jgi:MFS transporter, DHA3 family, tetracycline resistance protein
MASIKKLPPETAYLILALTSSLLFGVVFAANTLYFAAVVKLSPLELVLVGTALEVAIVVFEVPTGVVADVVSRRLSVLIGFALIGCGFMLEGLIPSFAAIVIAAFTWGIGYTFTSGATQAWLSDEIGEGNANALMLRVNVLQRYLGFLVIPLSVLLAFSSLQVPIVVGGIGFLSLAAFLAVTMPETNFQPHPHARQGVFAGMKATLLEALRFARDNATLRIVFVVTIIFGAASESFDRLWQVHLLNFGMPRLESVLGIVALSEAQSLLIGFAAINLTVTLAGLPLARWATRVNASDPRAVARSLLLVTTGLGCSLVAFALSPNLTLAVVAYIAARVCRDVHGPLSGAWLNQRLEPSTRATVLSLNGQADAVGQIAGGPVIGALGNASLRLALLCGSGILAACLPLYNRASNLRAKDAHAPD